MLATRGRLSGLSGLCLVGVGGAAPFLDMGRGSDTKAMEVESRTMTSSSSREESWGGAPTPPDTPTSPSCPCRSSETSPLAPSLTATPSSTSSCPGCPSWPSRPSFSSMRDKARVSTVGAEQIREATKPNAEPVPNLNPNPGLGWTLRSRRHRLSARPEKQLFTPDIKKLLKGWLVRRRDNPYPSRAEKEALARRTGLTYMQICNWFANWRRKLRDCGRGNEKGLTVAQSIGQIDSYPDVDEDSLGHVERERERVRESSWAHLIRRYNARAAAPNSSTAQEHFSIASSDSIWGPGADQDHDQDHDAPAGPGPGQHRDSKLFSDAASDCEIGEFQQNAYVSSTTSEYDMQSVGKPCTSTLFGSQSGMKRCLSGEEDEIAESEVKRPRLDSSDTSSSSSCEDGSAGSALLLSKWLESAARYQPTHAHANSPPHDQTGKGCQPFGRGRCHQRTQSAGPDWSIATVAVEHTLQGRHREELDAAEALTFLSSLHFR